MVLLSLVVGVSSWCLVLVSRLGILSFLCLVSFLLLLFLLFFCLLFLGSCLVAHQAPRREDRDSQETKRVRLFLTVETNEKEREGRDFEKARTWGGGGGWVLEKRELFW